MAFSVFALNFESPSWDFSFHFGRICPGRKKNAKWLVFDLINFASNYSIFCHSTSQMQLNPVYYLQYLYCFRVLGASFSRFGSLVFEFRVLRASVFVFQCFVFETTADCGNIFITQEQNWKKKVSFVFFLKILDSSHSSIYIYIAHVSTIKSLKLGKWNHNFI